MGRLKKVIYAVGFYQVGMQIYRGADTYCNIKKDETTLKERLSVYRDGEEGTKWAVITGASEGIGASYALQLAQCGYNVRLVARSEDKMAQVAEKARSLNPNIKTDIVPLDVTKASP